MDIKYAITLLAVPLIAGVFARALVAMASRIAQRSEGPSLDYGLAVSMLAEAEHESSPVMIVNGSRSSERARTAVGD